MKICLLLIAVLLVCGCRTPLEVTGFWRDGEQQSPRSELVLIRATASGDDGYAYQLRQANALLALFHVERKQIQMISVGPSKEFMVTFGREAFGRYSQTITIQAGKRGPVVDIIGITHEGDAVFTDQQTFEKHGGQISSEGAPSAPPNESSP